MIGKYNEEIKIIETNENLCVLDLEDEICKSSNFIF